MDVLARVPLRRMFIDTMGDFLIKKEEWKNNNEINFDVSGASKVCQLSIVFAYLPIWTKA